MVAGDNNNDVDEDGTMGNKVDDDGNGTTGDDDDDDNDDDNDNGDDYDDGDGDGAMGSGATGYDDDDDGRTIAAKYRHAVGRRHPMPPPNDYAPLPCPDALPKQHCTPKIYWDDVCLTWHAHKSVFGGYYL